ncbi:hypothetical protein F4824DRAFT_128662 [Ustulina deusta]|nr:hypothetical protein F4823DRAFT_585047 [Ustulina deusta]KAI3343043.1 hypothetical protein F4824DRAFT_128662 [Ustulina deusta]
MQSSMRMRAAARVPPPTSSVIPKGGVLAQKKALLPTLAWLGAACAIGVYVSRQLHQKSDNFDRIFAQQNTPEVEAARKRDLLVDTYGDPRNTLFNALGWTK